MKLIPYVKYAGKAVLAGVAAFAASAVTASLDGHWTQPEVWTAVGFTASSVAAVFGFQNGPKPPAGPKA